jgi:hypothetical protein
VIRPTVTKFIYSGGYRACRGPYLSNACRVWPLRLLGRPVVAGSRRVGRAAGGAARANRRQTGRVGHVQLPYEFIGFGSADVSTPYESTWFGDIHGPKLHEFMGSRAAITSHMPVAYLFVETGKVGSKPRLARRDAKRPKPLDGLLSRSDPLNL